MREAINHRGRREAEVWFQERSSLCLIAQGALEQKLYQRSCSIQRLEDWAVDSPWSSRLTTGHPCQKAQETLWKSILLWVPLCARVERNYLVPDEKHQKRESRTIPGAHTGLGFNLYPLQPFSISLFSVLLSREFP